MEIVLEYFADFLDVKNGLFARFYAPVVEHSHEHDHMCLFYFSVFALDKVKPFSQERNYLDKLYQILLRFDRFKHREEILNVLGDPSYLVFFILVLKSKER